MKRAAAALRAFLADGVGLEGAFLIVGAVFMGVGTAIWLGPAAPWIVLGAYATLIGIALAIPPRRS